MKHQGTQLLQTPRLILRPLQLSDAPAMYENWASNEKVTKFLTWPPHEDISVTQALLTSWVRDYQNPAFYQWGIILTEQSDQPIGTISVVSSDDRMSKMEIGYCLGEPWWGEGIMSEALQAVMDFLFHVVQVNRLESRHDLHNPGSGAVLKKSGFLYEGTRRQADWNNQGVCDVALYGILQADYDETR
ncbi:MAG: GNAT family N-acetyltransferase [Culicoidibacterales bacterium]